jgi:drug/metabolite transporter (DMT)-like permease
MKRSWNPRIWIGFVLSLAAMVSYPTVFARYPVTRDFPWVTLLLIALGIFLVASGVARAFRHPDVYRGKLSGSILGVMTVLLVGFFLVAIFYETRQIPASHGAPLVGQIAPDFTLPDSKGDNVTLSSLLASSFSADEGPTTGAASDKTAAVALIFYRGYW